MDSQKFIDYLCGMARIMAIDYGTKRCGVAVTDPLQTCAFGVDTFAPEKLISFIKSYTTLEKVSTLVVGEPKQRDNSPSEIESKIAVFLTKLKREFPTLDIVRYDERFTSVIAHKTIISSGIKKSKRNNKLIVDKISATIILQSYLENLDK